MSSAKPNSLKPRLIDKIFNLYGYLFGIAILIVGAIFYAKKKGKNVTKTIFITLLASISLFFLGLFLWVRMITHVSKEDEYYRSIDLNEYVKNSPNNDKLAKKSRYKN